MTLPNYLQAETEELIRSRILARLPATWDQAEGSILWDVISPVAIELTQAAIWLNEALRRGFASTTFGAYLDARCTEHGLSRRPASKAQSTGDAIQFQGAAGTLIPASFVVSTSSTDTIPAIMYQTLRPLVLPSSGVGYVDVEALEAGRAGNVAAGAIQHIASPLAGIRSVTNVSVITGGTDEEDDTSLLQRYFQRVRHPSTSGNVSHYMQWATEVPGVGAAKVTELWDGPGTVKVSIVDTDQQPALPALVTTVADHIETVRPVCVNVTVVSATALNIHVAATIVLASGYTLQTVQDTFKAVLTEYMSSIAFEETYVSYARIGTLLLGTDGVLDYTGLTLNSGTVNVALGDNQVPVIGIVSLGV